MNKPKIKYKKYKYHTSHKYTTVDVINDNRKITCVTQLYRIGVYVCVEGFTQRLQLNISPNDMVKMEKSLKKDLDKGLIKDLEFGIEITVIEEDGFWKQINNTDV